MPKIKPFKATLYNKDLISDFNIVVAPPYDVITPEEREIFANKSPYNIVHLTLPEGEGDKKYENAKKKMLSWLLKDVIFTDKDEGIFIYEQKFSFRGKNYKRRGIVAIMMVEDYGNGVFRHEKTFGGPKEDRKKLMESVDGHLEPLFFLYADKGSEINNKIYDMEFDYTSRSVVDEFGVKHTLWKIPDKKLEEFIINKLSQSNIYIADGHHRYETSLLYAKEKGLDETKPYSYVLAAFFNMYSKDLVILPTQRLVKVDSFLQDEFMKKVNEYFKIAAIQYSDEVADVSIARLVSVMRDRKEKGMVCFGLYSMYDPSKIYLITLKEELKDGIIKELSDIFGPEVASLDVLILTEIVLKRILGLSDEKVTSKAYVDYTRYEKDAISTVKKGVRDLAFLLNPTSIEEVIKVSEKNLVMPQKSTDFFPKIESGLVMYLFGEQ
jgi:uncharacterized protein (DUF1015 family)